jgi:hypothetical protein
MIYAVCVAPAQFHKKHFRYCWKFLLIKWRPDVWWFGPIVVIRALLLCMTHIFSQEGQRQLMWQLAIMICYGSFAAVFRPWRYWSANVFDSVVCGALSLFLAFSMNFVARSSWLDDSVAIFTDTFSFLPAAIYIFTVLWILLRLVLKAPIVSLVKDSSDNMQAALAKFCGLDQKAAEAFVSHLVEHDLEALRRVSFLLSVELLRDPGKSRAYQWMARMPTSDRIPSRIGMQTRHDDPELFDTGDLTTDGGVEQSKWGQSPPNRMPPLPASRGADPPPSDKGKGNSSARTNSTSVTPPPPLPSPPPPPKIGS